MSRAKTERTNKAFDKAYVIMKKTDGFIQRPSDAMHADIDRCVTPLERANDVFWNIVSIGNTCGAAITPAQVNVVALMTVILRFIGG